MPLSEQGRNVMQARVLYLRTRANGIIDSVTQALKDVRSDTEYAAELVREAAQLEADLKADSA